ncbi:uncharacterized protein DEA37_0003787 [Paragonimus westermani]|uniref:Calcineurin-like phosphoesterase domain-containing protein n=1 Tax=Paragonimus westermani TaxID=34504 RepID=A0A5J4NBS0_9TREM|nr:uncharacterized protein DEA37_0003787 [Paragonimus westermani]
MVKKRRLNYSTLVFRWLTVTDSPSVVRSAPNLDKALNTFNVNNSNQSRNSPSCEAHVQTRLTTICKDWQMKQSFQAARTLLSPDVVFILGDIFDEGLWLDDPNFESHVERYNNIFRHDSLKTVVKNLVGNHDIGFHYA